MAQFYIRVKNDITKELKQGVYEIFNQHRTDPRVVIFTDGYTQACLAWAAEKSYYKHWRSLTDGVSPTDAWKEFLIEMMNVTDEQIVAQARKCVKKPPYNFQASQEGWAGLLMAKREYLKMIVEAEIEEIVDVDI